MSQASMRLGDFVFDPATGELTRDGRTTRLRPQAARALAGLASRPGDLVTREELTELVWPKGRLDADLGLNVCIRQIRVALGDDASAPAYIETLRSRGYRLLAEVAALDEREPTRGPRGARRAWLAGAGTVAVIVLSAAWFRSPPEEASPVRIAVAPFEGARAGDSLDYFRAGLVDDVVGLLARSDPADVAVIASSSSQRVASEGLTGVEMAQRLDADYVVQGALRDTDGQLRLTVRLLETTSGTYAWSEVFDLVQQSMLTVDEAVVRGVLSSLPRPVVQTRVALGRSSPARDAVLRARFLVAKQTRDGAERALALLDEARATDSLHGPVWIERANAHLLLGQFDQAEESIRRAREVAPSASGLELAAGRIALYGRRDPATAERHLTKAVADEPGSAAVRHALAQVLSARGAHAEAMRHGSTALSLDPVSSVVRGDIGWVFYYAGDYARARRSCADALELVPQSVGARICLILSAHFQGRLVDEGPVISDVLTSLGAAADDIEFLLDGVAAGTVRPLWSWLLDNGVRSGQLDDLDRARLLMLLGRSDDATEALAAARAEGRFLLWVPVDPVFAPLATTLD